MINRQEIDNKAIEFEINPAKVERDYVFGWILYGLFTASDLKQTLFLKGGNALRKGYFANTRFSADLDFGMPGDIAPETLRSEFNKICDLIRAKSGIEFVTTDTIVQEKFAASEAPLPDLKVYEMRLYFKDFYGKPGHIKLRVSMDLTRFDKVLLPLQSRELIHPYSDASDVACAITCMKLEEIIATKLKCLMQRQHAPDLFDYAYSISLLGGELDKNQVVNTLIKKTIFARNPAVLKKILLTTAFDYFKQQWANSVVCAKAVFMKVEDAIAIFTDDLEKIFSAFPDTGFAQFTYFRPEHRALILQAGRTQTLLKVHYKGEERLVEPYSIKYLMRRDGVEREYFYCHKLTGGESGPGLQSLVPDKLQAIRGTDTPFEPRHPIELSKAGELPENRYLFDPNKPTKAPKRIARSRRSAWSTSTVRYKYRCGSCGKTFTKSTQSPLLGAHKNPNGWACGGRSGFYVETLYG